MLIIASTVESVSAVCFTSLSNLLQVFNMVLFYWILAYLQLSFISIISPIKSLVDRISSL